MQVSTEKFKSLQRKFRHGDYRTLWGILVDACDGSFPGDSCELDRLYEIEQGPLGKDDPRYDLQRDRCAMLVMFELSGDPAYNVR